MCYDASPPTTPDPAATASTQYQYNSAAARDTARLGRVNQVNPGSTVTWSQDPNNQDIYTQTTAYTGDQATANNNTMKLGAQASQVGLDQLGRVGTSLSTPFSLSGATQTVGNVNRSGLPTMQSSVGPTGPIQSSVDYSGIPALAGANDFSGDRTKVEDAMYSRLNPQFDRDRASLATELANKGVTEGSAAYNNAIDELDRTKTDARNQVTLAGGQEQSRMFGLSLAARQQLTGEKDFQGQFANSAQAQQYAQALSSGQFNNQARAQGYQENLTDANLQNQKHASDVSDIKLARDQPLNELSSLFSLSQVTPATPYAPNQVNFAAPDYQGLVNSNYLTNNANAQASANRTNSTVNALLGATGGVGAAAIMACSREYKHPLQVATPESALAAVRALPLEFWQYRTDAPMVSTSDAEVPHIGTYAEDFNALLGLPPSKSISMVDAFGAVLGAVQAIDARQQQMMDRVDRLLSKLEA